MWSLDDSIIKSLKICTNHPRLCDGCMYSKAHMIKYECITGLNGAALALIERQKAEIEQLNAMVAAAEEHLYPLPFKTAYDEEIQKAKSEAIRKFVEKLKEKANHETYNDSYGGEKFSYTISTVDFDDIDQTVDEMDGDTP